MKSDRRFNRETELRLDEPEADKVVLIGNAVIYNSLSEDLGCFREIIAPGTFTEALKTADVRCLIDHNPSLLLGRTESGTLRLFDGPKALRIECDLDDTTYATDLRKTIRRRDRNGMSFGFIVEEDRWEEDAAGVTRTVTKADIFDVSFVTYPAYKATDSGERALDDTAGAIRSLEAWKLSRAKPPASGDEIRRLTLKLSESFLRPR